jgi:PAS domain S-box-containing protein
MSRIRTLVRPRLPRLNPAFGLWRGTAFVVLPGHMFQPALRASVHGAVVSSLIVGLAALCCAALLLLVRTIREPSFRDAAAKAAVSTARAVAKNESTDESIPTASERLRIILDHLPSSFVLMDADRRILAASSNFEQVTGRRLDEIAGRHCTRGLWSEGFCVGCPSELAGRSGRPEREVVQVGGPDGTARFLEHLSVPIRDHGGPSSILEVVTDITHRRSLQERMAKAEKLAMAGEMASVVTHEMRNSLTSVKMILQLLQEASEGESASEELLAVALGSVQHAEGILNELLQFAGPAPPQLQDYDPAHMVEEAANLVRFHLDERHVELELATEDLPYFRGDPEQIKTALFNLLLNACQAVEPGGRIALRCRRHHSRDALILEVEDSGPGVPESLVDRVFDPFFTTKVKGTGLGLPMVKRIVDVHHGTVTLCNLHPGCRFTIALPMTCEDVS